MPVYFFQLWNSHSQGLQVARSFVAVHPGAAGEGDDPDALQQVVEEHWRCVHQTGTVSARSPFVFLIKCLPSATHFILAQRMITYNLLSGIHVSS